jgi:hypothetical protein
MLAAQQLITENVEFKESLPLLLGTVKQIKWANKIRAEKIYSLQEALRNATDYNDAKIISLIINHTSSSFWIKHRDDRISLIIKNCKKHYEVFGKIFSHF